MNMGQMGGAPEPVDTKKEETIKNQDDFELRKQENRKPLDPHLLRRFSTVLVDGDRFSFGGSNSFISENANIPEFQEAIKRNLIQFTSSSEPKFRPALELVQRLQKVQREFPDSDFSIVIFSPEVKLATQVGIISLLSKMGDYITPYAADFISEIVSVFKLQEYPSLLDLNPNFYSLSLLEQEELRNEHQKINKSAFTSGSLSKESVTFGLERLKISSEAVVKGVMPEAMWRLLHNDVNTAKKIIEKFQISPEDARSFAKSYIIEKIPQRPGYGGIYPDEVNFCIKELSIPLEFLSSREVISAHKIKFTDTIISLDDDNVLDPQGVKHMQDYAETFSLTPEVLQDAAKQIIVSGLLKSRSLCSLATLLPQEILMSSEVQEVVKIAICKDPENASACIEAFKLSPDFIQSFEAQNSALKLLSSILGNLLHETNNEHEVYVSYLNDDSDLSNEDYINKGRYSPVNDLDRAENLIRLYSLPEDKIQQSVLIAVKRRLLPGYYSYSLPPVSTILDVCSTFHVSRESLEPLFKELLLDFYSVAPYFVDRFIEEYSISKESLSSSEVQEVASKVDKNNKAY